MPVKKIYLFGPMRGIKNFNFPAFWSAAYHLRKQGYLVVSPAEIDIVEGKVRVTYSNDRSCIITNPLEFGYSERSLRYFKVEWDGDVRDLLRRDLIDVCEADGLVGLPGWIKSWGSNVEVLTGLCTRI